MSFKRVLLRSVATATAVGSALAVSLAATPAVVTAAPEIRTVACGDTYTPFVPTETTISLSRAAVVYGVFVRATATVTGGDTTPTGTVTFTLSSGGSATPIGTVELSGGTASVALPRYISANRTYEISASYTPDGCFESSVSDPSAFLTVYKRASATSAVAPSRARGQRPVVSVSVGARGGLTPTGRVAVVIKRNGVVKRSLRVWVNGGRTVSFSRLQPGYYVATARYFGNTNFSGSVGRDGFRVRRR